MVSKILSLLQKNISNFKNESYQMKQKISLSHQHMIPIQNNSRYHIEKVQFEYFRIKTSTKFLENV